MTSKNMAILVEGWNINRLPFNRLFHKSPNHSVCGWSSLWLISCSYYVIMHVKHKRNCIQSKQGIGQHVLHWEVWVLWVLRCACHRFSARHSHTHTLHEDRLTPHTVKFAVAETYWHSENETTDIRLIHLQSNHSSLAKNNRLPTRLAIITTKITSFILFSCME